ncbi:hypothetical protein HMI54_000558 [Coelomomyces lativittatus]|nr:hypothetical protein HMI54_000558 [Coelomomyces lativittatus]
MQALFDVSDILLQYDADQEVPLYGFGAVLPGNTAVSHNFHVNFNPDNPQVKGSEGILDAYLRCLPQLRLSGPTCFAPILNEFCNVIQNFPKKKIYFVLLILTDGVICDLQATKDALVAASYLPLSIVIVGMGQSDFSAMQELDADVHPLVNGEGKKAIRDLVQFVPFHQFFKKQDNEAGRRLAAEVLHEIPTQFLKYMEQNNIQL